MLMFDIHNVKDDSIVEIILSFCDFRTIISAGETCTRLHQISKACLDHAAEYALTNENNVLPLTSGWDNEILRTNKWTFGSKAALIEDAMEFLINGHGNYCSPRDNDVEEYIHFNADEARHLLRTRGRVCIEDFADNDHERYYESREVGWDVGIRYCRNCMLKKAVYEIIYPGDKRVDDPNIDYDDDDNEFVTTSDPLKYYSLCLLRKASLSLSIKFAYMNVDYRHPDYASHVYRSSIMWTVPTNHNNRNGTNVAADDDDNGIKVEFFYAKDYSPNEY
mmetsp:Transcript_3389/g.3839  ORF Transcript_3389/g.3839 Transcript_3389/m.3839 type:complete len:278 (+) Transcript_3389:190-1023(+)